MILDVSHVTSLTRPPAGRLNNVLCWDKILFTFLGVTKIAKANIKAPFHQSNENKPGTNSFTSLPKDVVHETPPQLCRYIELSKL